MNRLFIARVFLMFKDVLHEELYCENMRWITLIFFNVYIMCVMRIHTYQYPYMHSMYVFL